MVRVLESKFIKNADGTYTHYMELAGLFTDDKPVTGICTGSVFLEVNTGKVYLFDEEEPEWYEVGGSSGGSDSSDDADPAE